MEKALFTSRVSALKGCIKAGRARGVNNETIMVTGNAFPVYNRGELKGWHGWVSLYGTNVRSPVMEREVV